MGSRLLRQLERLGKSVGTFVFRPLVASDSPRTVERADFKRILVIRQHNQLGDMLCVVPTLRALRRKYPLAIITLLASPVNFDVMQHNEYLNETLLFDKSMFVSRGFLRLLRLLGFIRNLRRYGFDLALVPSTVSMSATSNLLAYLSGASTRIGPRSIDGHRNATGFFFNVGLTLDWRNTPEKHQTERNMEYLRPLNIEGEKNRASVITLNQQERSEAKLLLSQILHDKTSFIVFHPGAGKIPNRWQAQNFALVANILSMEFDAFVLVTSGAFDGDPVQDMISTLSVQYEVVQNRPIRLVASILSEADLLVTNDTGIMHVGGAVGIPVLSLFGPTDPYQWAPIGPAHRFIRAKDGNIDTIAVDDVLKHAREMLRFSRMIRSGDRPFLAEH